MKRVKTFRFSEADLAALDELSEAFGGASEAETLRRLVAEGLRYRMEHCTPPIHPHFLDAIRPEAMPQEFLDYIDAVREQAGVMRPDGTTTFVPPAAQVHVHLVLQSRRQHLSGSQPGRLLALIPHRLPGLVPPPRPAA